MNKPITPNTLIAILFWWFVGGPLVLGALVVALLVLAASPVTFVLLALGIGGLIVFVLAMLPKKVSSQPRR